MLKVGLVRVPIIFSSWAKIIKDGGLQCPSFPLFFALDQEKGTLRPAKPIVAYSSVNCAGL